MGYSPRGHKESGTIERTYTHFCFQSLGVILEGSQKLMDHWHSALRVPQGPQQNERAPLHLHGSSLVSKKPHLRPTVS